MKATNGRSFSVAFYRKAGDTPLDGGGVLKIPARSLIKWI